MEDNMARPKRIETVNAINMGITDDDHSQEFPHWTITSFRLHESAPFANANSSFYEKDLHKGIEFSLLDHGVEVNYKGINRVFTFNNIRYYDKA